MQDGAKLRMRKDAVCTIGKNTPINSNNAERGIKGGASQ